MKWIARGQYEYNDPWTLNVWTALDGSSLSMRTSDQCDMTSIKADYNYIIPQNKSLVCQQNKMKVCEPCTSAGYDV